MATVKIEIEDEKYEVDEASLSMGEQWLLEREFGVEAYEDGTVKFGFGGFLGLLVIALTREGVPEAAAKARVLALKNEQVSVTREEDEPRPTRAAKGGSKSKTAGRSGTSGT